MGMRLISLRLALPGETCYLEGHSVCSASIGTTQSAQCGVCDRAIFNFLSLCFGSTSYVLLFITSKAQLENVASQDLLAPAVLGRRERRETLGLRALQVPSHWHPYPVVLLHWPCFVWWLHLCWFILISGMPGNVGPKGEKGDRGVPGKEEFKNSAIKSMHYAKHGRGGRVSE